VVYEASVLARIANSSRLRILHEPLRHPARGRKSSVWVVASGMCRLQLYSVHLRGSERPRDTYTTDRDSCLHFWSGTCRQALEARSRNARGH
jgi:hypothetical protein